MVAPIEAPRFGMRIRREVAALPLTCGHHVVDEVELGITPDAEVFLAADRLPCVDVEVRYGLADVIERVRCIIFGAEKPLLFAGDGEEHDRSLWPRFLCKGSRLLDQLRYAGAIVDCAIVGSVTGRIGLADAEMIPMGGINDRLVGIFLTRKEADDIVALDDLGRR